MATEGIEKPQRVEAFSAHASYQGRFQNADLHASLSVMVNSPLEGCMHNSVYKKGM